MKILHTHLSDSPRVTKEAGVVWVKAVRRHKGKSGTSSDFFLRGKIFSLKGSRPRIFPHVSLARI